MEMKEKFIGKQVFVGGKTAGVCATTSSSAFNYLRVPKLESKLNSNEISYENFITPFQPSFLPSRSLFSSLLYN
jgi:hypothetical protein